jgi:hypothetical protein
MDVSVVYGAAAWPLAVGNVRGGADGWWRLLGLDLGPFAPHQGGSASLRVAVMLHGGGGGAIAVSMWRRCCQPACCSMAAGALWVLLGSNGPIWAWCVPIVAFDRLPRWW